MAYSTFTAGQVVTAAQLNTLPHMLYSSLTAASGTNGDVNTTASEVSVMDSGTTYTVPAGLLGTNGTLYGIVRGDYLNNTAGASNLSIRVKYGATAIIGDGRSMAQGATRVPVIVEFWISNIAATNVQQGHAIWHGNSGPGAAATIGLDVVRVESVEGLTGAAAIDSTVAQAFDVTVQHGTSSASISFRRHKIHLFHWPVA